MIFSPPSGPTRPFSAERGRVHRLLSVACADVRVQAPWPSFRLLLQPSFCCSSSPFTLPVSNATTSARSLVRLAQDASSTRKLLGKALGRSLRPCPSLQGLPAQSPPDHL